MPKVSEEHKQGVRERILEALEDTWREKGAHELTTRDILARAGVSNGTLSHYFGSKDSLAAALAERLAERNLLALRLAGILEDSIPTVDRLGRLFPNAPLTFQGSLLPELRARAIHEEAVRQALHSFDRYLEDALLPLIEKAKTEGLIREDISAPALIELAFIFFEGLIARSNSNTLNNSQTDVYGLFVELLVDGAAPEAKRSELRAARK